MILNITYKGENTTDIGFLFYKNPKRAQVFRMPFGKAYVFYPEASYEKTTITLLLDIDPVSIMVNNADLRGNGTYHYINDKPYVSSHFMSMAIARVFTSAMTGKSDTYQELADSALELTTHTVMLPCKVDFHMLNRIFEPLGYEVNYETFQVDDLHPNLGLSKYVNLKLKAKIRLMELLNHIHVLMPVFDNINESMINRDEAKNLIESKSNKGWLECHPEYKFIKGRYLIGSEHFITAEMRRLLEQDGMTCKEWIDRRYPHHSDELLRLNSMKITNVLSVLRACNSKNVLVLNCGEGELISLLVKERGIERITGADSSLSMIKTAEQRFNLNNMKQFFLDRVHFIQSSLYYKDSRYDGYDAVCAVDVIEDMEPHRLKTFEHVFFEFARPECIIITAVSQNYIRNHMDKTKLEAKFHKKHIVWNKQKFRSWAESIAQEYNYMVQFSDIGLEHNNMEASAQMGVFTLCR